MKTKNTLARWLLPLTLSILATIYVAQPPSAVAQGTTFTYQGRLASGTDAANGIYDFTFALWNASSGGSQTGSTLSRSGVGATNGLFTTLLDFGGIFDGTTYWLEIGVRTNGAVSYTKLTPRQQLTPTPYAITAEHLSGTLPSSQLTGTLPAGLLSGTYGGVVNFNNASDSFAGNGSGLVNVNALTLGGLGANAFWKLTGNAGTTAGVNYVGTSDAQPLYLDVNGIPVLKLAANGALSMGSLTGIGSSSVALGYSAVAPGMFSTVSGGSLNGAGGDYSTIGGGQMNHISADPYPNSYTGTSSVIGGGISNTISAADSVIAGGRLNRISEEIEPGVGVHVISGGEMNVIAYDQGHSTIGGGRRNIVDSSESTIAGGAENAIAWNGGLTFGNTIGGGEDNQIWAVYSSTIAGGALNTIINYWGGGACIGGGYTNSAYGNCSTVPGGYGNVANGDYSFAAGRQAKAMHQGAFVWADSQNAAFSSTTNDQFLIRAQHGVGIGTTNPVAALDVAGSVHASGMIRLGSETNAAPPNYPSTGLVIRRVTSTTYAVNNVVVRTDTLTLERDGTHGGLLLRWKAYPGSYCVANATGITTSGAQVAFHHAFGNPAATGTVTVFSNAQNVSHYDISFGNPYSPRHLTHVVLDRYDGDYFIVGTVTSSYNQ